MDVSDGVRAEDIPDGHYGAATEPVRQVLRECGAFEWFPRAARRPPPDVARGLAQTHLGRLWLARPGAVPADPVEVVAGDFAVLAGLVAGRLDPEAWGDPWMGDRPWGAALTDVGGDVARRIEADPAIARLVRPPLWPLPGRTNVVSSLLANRVVDRYPSQDPARAIVCHVEFNAWRVLEWLLLHGGDGRACPFRPLFDAHRLGYYAVGFAGGRFVVYAFGEGEATGAAA